MARSLKQRVTSGAKFLDKKVPGWEKQVKRSKLVMEDNHLCVLGQLAPENTDAIDYGISLGLDMDGEDGNKYGFEAEEDETHEKLWQEEIKSRLDYPAPPAPAEKKPAKRKAQ